jgi:hypothetical protein
LIILSKEELMTNGSPLPAREGNHDPSQSQKA